MNNIIKTIFVSTLSICLITLVAWFVLNYPVAYPETQYEECKQYNKNKYQFGFCEGYFWAGTQLHIDNQIRNEIEENSICE